jgi:hypothetical protein
MQVASFDSCGSLIVKAAIAADKLEAKNRDAITVAMTKFLDACAVTGVPRDEAGTKAIGEEIRGCQALLDAVAQGHVKTNTVTNYAQGAMRAYFHNLKWTPCAYHNPEKGTGGLPFLPGGKGAKAAEAKAGSITKTTDKALLETLKKAIEQALILNRLEAKGMLIDVACTIDPEFKV